MSNRTDTVGYFNMYKKPNNHFGMDAKVVDSSHNPIPQIVIDGHNYHIPSNTGGYKISDFWIEYLDGNFWVRFNWYADGVWYTSKLLMQ